ncbi:MAG TPA: efflux RND transporter periplasmic adaptor subunit [Burkholderiaceae bacterium]|nr:efflux RND transporter periplasmic adaptor subunit [Burkholderiaceae bacterium]
MAIAFAAAGCGKDPGNGAPAAAASAASGPASGAGGPVSVGSVRAQAQDVDVMLEATGTIAALNSVDIRPQVASVIMQVNIREGQFVKAGQLLFTLDARNDQVNLAKAKAQLARDHASLADAQRQLARSRELLGQGFISQGALDTNQTLVDTQQAVVAADRAAIEAAQVGLSYNRIVAPAAGRAGAINVFAGSTVQPGGTALVTITQLDPIAVAFGLPQRYLNDALRTLRAGGGKVVAVLPDGRGEVTGRLQFVDNVVDPNSGTVRVKAVFDNPASALWPGAFVNVRLATSTLKGAVVVPQAAVIRGPRGTLVYTVDASSKAVARPVELLYAAGLDAAISGIQPGERVVVDGRQNLRDGVPVIERAASAAGNGRAASGPGAATPAAGASGAVGGVSP